MTASPPGGACHLEINSVLVTCGETIKKFCVTHTELGASLSLSLSVRISTTQTLINEDPSDVQVLRPIDLGPCTELEEIRLSPQGAQDPGPGEIHFFDSVTPPPTSSFPSTPGRSTHVSTLTIGAESTRACVDWQSDYGQCTSPIVDL